MVRVERHGDVTRYEFSTWRSRAIGYSVSAYLVRGVLVDTGFHAVRRDVARLVDELHGHGGDGVSLRGAVVTHKHEDHAGNVALLARRGVPLALAAATRDALRAVPPIRFYRRYTWGTMPSLGDAPFATLDDDALAAAAGLALLPTPGHSTDHHAVWDAERETLFGGDLFLGVKVRVAHPGEDPRRLVESLRAAAALRPKRLFDAHRGAVDDPAAKLAAKAGWVEETIGEIDRLAAAGWSEVAIRDRVLGREEAAGHFSRGDYSRLNFVRATMRSGGVPASLP